MVWSYKFVPIYTRFNSTHSPNSLSWPSMESTCTNTFPSLTDSTSIYIFMFISCLILKLVALLWLIICCYVLINHNCSWIPMIICCYVLSIHNSSLIIVKRIENIDKEKNEYLEKPDSKNNKIVGLLCMTKQHQTMWYGSTLHSWVEDLDAVISSMSGLIARYKAMKQWIKNKTIINIFPIKKKIYFLSTTRKVGNFQ